MLHEQRRQPGEEIDMQWYYAENGASVGPIGDDEFQGAVSSGKVTAETLVWHEGMSDWVAYNTTQGGSPGSAASTSKPLNMAPSVEAAAVTKQSAECAECGRAFSTADLMNYKGTYICAECKPAYFQRLEEGATGTDGNTPNAELTAMARESLKGNMGLALGIYLLYVVVMMAMSVVPVAGMIASLLASGPMIVGFTLCFLVLSRGQRPEISLLFSGFKRFSTCLGAFWLMYLFVMLWSLLLIIPGIVAGVAYSQIFFIIADDPSVGAMEALERSKAMMQGRKWKYFCLCLRFMGWWMLVALLFGIMFPVLQKVMGPVVSIAIPYILMLAGGMFIAVYMFTSMAHFYNDVSQRNIDG